MQDIVLKNILYSVKCEWVLKFLIYNFILQLVEYKQQAILEEKRKKALDQHLSFIVDQTEKYSTLVAESMNKTGVESASQSVGSSSRPPTPPAIHHTSDGEHLSKMLS